MAKRIPKDGVYRLKERIKNPKPSGDYKLWTACAHIPPDDDEWDGCPARELDDFTIVIQDVEIMGRTYKEAMLANAAWTTGFFVGKVPTLEDFPDISEEDKEELEEELYYSQSHSDEPAPQGFLDALVPVKGQTLEEILLMYAQYEGVDPMGRLYKESWTETVYAAVSHECRNDPEIREKVESAIRRLLVRDSNRSRLTYTSYDENGNKDVEAGKLRDEEETKRILNVRSKQYKAFMEFDRQRRER
jgi:hypothetical protein